MLPAANRAVMDSLDYFIVENTRSVRRFLSKAGIARPIDTLEFRELNEHTVAGREVEELVKPLVEGRSAGVVSKRACRASPIPGLWSSRRATATVSAWCRSSGRRPSSWPSWPRGSTGSRSPSTATCPSSRPNAGPGDPPLRTPCAVRNASRSSFIEAPYRNVKLMEQLLQTLAPETRLTLAMDITAPGEYIRTLAVREWRSVRLCRK